MHWQKLHHIAEKVTDTQVRLNLPNQTTPKGHGFCIEGIVDIVREEEKVTMYDIKTHDLEFVKKNKNCYGEQLNVYAYIWQKLHNQRIDETAVIATPLPEKMIDALRMNDLHAVAAEYEKWDPIVPIPFDETKVQNTVQEFGRVVDNIEEHRFSPPSVSKLNSREGTKDTFATRVCRNCDARFSCDSYRQYAVKYKDRKWTKLAGFCDRPAEAKDRIDREEAAMPEMKTAETAAQEL